VLLELGIYLGLQPSDRKKSALERLDRAS
jgi:hypothetical protein